MAGPASQEGRPSPQDIVIYLSKEEMENVFYDVHDDVDRVFESTREWDGKRDISIPSLSWLVFRLKGTIE